jgi:Fe-S-cluster containining protein
LILRIPSVVLQTAPSGGCVFYAAEEGLCAIHEVAPWGCAYFDTHMDRDEADDRVRWYVSQMLGEPWRRKPKEKEVNE